jgi:Ca2+/Na+ antiporter
MGSSDFYSALTHHLIQILALLLLLVLGAELLVKQIRTLLESVRLLYRDVRASRRPGRHS